MPKGIYHSHRSDYIYTMQKANSYHVSRSDVTIVLSPMFHVQGGGEPLVAPYAGTKLVLPGRYSLDDPGPLVELIAEEEATFTSAVTPIQRAMAEYIQEELDGEFSLDGARFITGGTAPSEELVRTFRDWGIDLLNTYGASEATTLISVNHAKPDNNLSEDEEIRLRTRKTLPVPGVQVRLVDPQGGESVARDGEAVGEVLVDSPWTTSAYYDDPRTAESFTDDGFWRTGDLGTIDDAGYLELVDRVKDGIKSGGEWISSADMENMIRSHPVVAGAAVVGLEHPKWDERPFAVIRLGADATATEDDILEHLAGEFAEWQLPDELEFVEEIPTTSVGKNDKATIRERYEGRYTNDA
jgi:fatty-acyl-CoA synthase